MTEKKKDVKAIKDMTFEERQAESLKEIQQILMKYEVGLQVQPEFPIAVIEGRKQEDNEPEENTEDTGTE